MPLCRHYHLSYYPYIVYGNPASPVEYGGSRDYQSFDSFVRSHITPTPRPTPTPLPVPIPLPVPTPPTPTPAPTPAGQSHYGKPPCLNDEVVLNLDGSFCSPVCDGSDASCPTDVPTGATAPKCSLKTGGGQHQCALSCTSDSECPSGAQCMIPFNICQYTDYSLRKTVADAPHFAGMWQIEVTV